jgi:hypothetical protein
MCEQASRMRLDPSVPRSPRWPVKIVFTPKAAKPLPTVSIAAIAEA